METEEGPPPSPLPLAGCPQGPPGNPVSASGPEAAPFLPQGCCGCWAGHGQAGRVCERARREGGLGAFGGGRQGSPIPPALPPPSAQPRRPPHGRPLSPFSPGMPRGQQRSQRPLAGLAHRLAAPAASCLDASLPASRGGGDSGQAFAGVHFRLSVDLGGIISPPPLLTFI